ncbi:enoyl-CoA hydratase [Mycolicibacterium fortuitum]|uniref:Enoyl-CoA hydratase n=1 Tax=Mycolicibacterium fortuitum subsp. fortuitum DSM 46621 = ATCC 6841 = JCM 6387 TaxID=1214102 RepID=K0UX60_MYCFO|nr:enoyl-CoA hydratase [Mycolicibacterium fortuitum]AIY47982.1 Enoyl-CoA hydratase [Mycobacterium sp. VKM Ac-1817D]CRL71549.1 enoyl-CoA hydratase [Mycolicibacter nonchromogenicus]EJZ09650.1 enoyl-CoA hydratase [Mycolicibacterium fortuitum subsp. fortuitum DSM 46621 = ATCC 6841 = JCM 6387]WEV31579.1 enoyl-CoA hydratase [Mycolicibacterium fortuitum]CRL55471.1 enoyl-CoA hydratase [Mycolicibacterium fortuitum subsp. fortuitum DSM 46621 = ATCC 6841 = JCM 6387]
MSEFETVRYERPADKVARIVLDRPEARNAQSMRMLYELNDAFDLAAQDDSVSVIILAANGPHFSAGHDLREQDALQVVKEHHRVGTWCGFGCAGAESQMAVEKEMYLGLSERWRNLPKPTIAAVQGKVIAGGLMLVWPCDLIVAAEDALFQDNTVSMGVSGAEFFNHPFEVGVRKAKEMLFTSDFLTAAEVHRLGMVNHVVPLAELEAFTLQLASRIAEKPLFALKLAKEAVNVAQDNQGRAGAMQTSFAYHQLCHSHNQQIHGMLIDPGFMEKTFKTKVEASS